MRIDLLAKLVMSLPLLAVGCANENRQPSPQATAEQMRGRVVRLAELEIDSAQLENYRAALREEIETSIRVEPGVLTLYAVSEKEYPARVRIFETYANEAAYRAHLETSHFKKYKTGTQAMVKSLKLVEADPIWLGAKAK